jgi:hypothetical protein
MGSFIRSIRFPEDLKNEIEKEMKESSQKYNTVVINLCWRGLKVKKEEREILEKLRSGK